MAKIYAHINVKNYGEMVIELLPTYAPITVENFIKLAKDGFYTNLIFHRIIKDFMIQGGDPTGTGMGGSKQEIKGEFLANGVRNINKHVRGTISMARTQVMDSASSQFFICHVDCPFLDGNYAAFGQMVTGFDVLDKIASVKTDANDRPLEDVVIESVTIEEKND